MSFDQAPLVVMFDIDLHHAAAMSSICTVTAQQ